MRGFCVKMGGGCHIIFTFSWRFLVMHHKKYWCVYLSFVNKHVLQNNCLNKIEIIGILIVLIMLIVILAVLITHSNNKNYA